MNTNARSKATHYLANAFRELRTTRNIEVLEYWFIFLDGFTQGLEAVGRITKEQAEKIIEQRDKIYDARIDLLQKKKADSGNYRLRRKALLN